MLFLQEADVQLVVIGCSKVKFIKVQVFVLQKDENSNAILYAFCHCETDSE